MLIWVVHLDKTLTLFEKEAAQWWQLNTDDIIRVFLIKKLEKVQMKNYCFAKNGGKNDIKSYQSNWIWLNLILIKLKSFVYWFICYNTSRFNQTFSFIKLSKTWLCFIKTWLWLLPASKYGHVTWFVGSIDCWKIFHQNVKNAVNGELAKSGRYVF